LLPDKLLLESALLVVAWQRGDPDAFAAIVKLWEPSLFVFLRRLARTEADAWDLLQETWLKLLRSRKSLRDPEAFPAFMYKIARHAAFSRFRYRTAETEHFPEEVVDDRSLDDLSGFDNSDQLHYALDQLPIAQREALTLFFLRELSLSEIAAVLEAPLGTVKSRLHYGKIALRKILTEELTTHDH